MLDSLQDLRIASIGVSDRGYDTPSPQLRSQAQPPRDFRRGGNATDARILIEPREIVSWIRVDNVFWILSSRLLRVKIRALQV